MLRAAFYPPRVVSLPSWSSIDYVSKCICLNVLFCPLTLYWLGSLKHRGCTFSFENCVWEKGPSRWRTVLCLCLLPSLRLLWKLDEWQESWVGFLFSVQHVVYIACVLWNAAERHSPSTHPRIFIHWHTGCTEQRLRGQGLWNDNARSSSSRQRHPLLLVRNVLTNCERPQCQPPPFVELFFFMQVG